MRRRWHRWFPTRGVIPRPDANLLDLRAGAPASVLAFGRVPRAANAAGATHGRSSSTSRSPGYRRTAWRDPVIRRPIQHSDGRLTHRDAVDGHVRRGNRCSRRESIGTGCRVASLAMRSMRECSAKCTRRVRPRQYPEPPASRWPARWPIAARTAFSLTLENHLTMIAGFHSR